jgi:hypothetical protein
LPAGDGMRSYESYREHRERAAKLIAQNKFADALDEIDLAIMDAPDGELLHIASELRRTVAPRAQKKPWQFWRTA